MKLNAPIWNPQLAGFIIRIPLGIYFLMAGRMKLHNIDDFLATVRRFGMLPDQFSTLYGVLVPYLEVLVGVLLIVGIWTTLTAMIGSVMIVAFSLVFGLGLFPSNPGLINKDIILLGGMLSLLSSGAGAMSIDRFRQTG